MSNKIKEKEKLEKDFLELYNQGKKDSEIAVILNKGATTIGVLRNKLNLPPNGRIIVEDEVFLELFYEGLTLAEVCRRTGMSAAAATRRCKKLELDYKNSKNVKVNYNKIDEDYFIQLYNERNTDVEIAKILNCSESKINAFRSKLNLPVVDRKHFTDEEFIKVYNDDYTDREISKILNTSEGYIISRRNKLQLPPNKKVVEITPLSSGEFQVILGTVLGDSYLGKPHLNGNVFGSCAHCLEQEELIFTKYNYLKNISKEPYLQKMHDDRFKIPDYNRWFWYIYTNPALTEIYPLFYNNKIKYINKELLLKIEPLGLAIWFMDDGSNGTYGYKLCTNGFSLEDLKIIKEVFLEKFQIEINFHKDNSIYIPAKYKNKFKNLISPFIIPSMLYKII